MITINSVPFEPHPSIGFLKFGEPKEVNYARNYVKIVEDVQNKRYTRVLFGKEVEELTQEEGNRVRFVMKQEKDFPGALLACACRDLIRSDLWFLLYFVVKPFADDKGRAMVNHPFVVRYCQEIERGPKDYTLDLAARFHFKTSIITVAETIQYQLVNPEYATGIFSHKAPIAKDFLFTIKSIFETERMLVATHPDVVWEDCKREAPLWSLDEGIILKRKSTRREASVSAHGLVEGMPTGLHFERRVYDDISTNDMAQSMDIVDKVKHAFDVSQNLKTLVGSHHRVTGTYYSHQDPLIYVRDKKNLDGNSKYHIRFKPATEDGTAAGIPVLMTQEGLDELKNDSSFNCHAAGTKILMADFSEKNIEDIEVGNKVIGFVKNRHKTRLIQTDVLSIGNRETQVYNYRLQSGKITTCTADHKWWIGRWKSGNDNRVQYATLDDKGQNGKTKSGLIKMFSSIPEIPLDMKIIKACTYLGGIFDGEGTLSRAKTSSSLRIFQSEKENPDVCDKIRKSLMVAGFKAIEYRSRKNCLNFYISGGKSETLRFLKWCEITKWKEETITAMCGGNNGSCKRKDKLIEKTDAGMTKVYNIQTGTGNYIANGYGSKNCQQLLDPTPQADQRLNPDFLQKIDYQFIPRNLYHFMTIDQAGDAESNKTRNTDAWAIGMFGVEPISDDIGQSKVFIEDLWIEVAGESEAIDMAVRMYLASGIVSRLGVEKVGVSTTHIHISKALRARGRYVTFDDKANKMSTGVLLRPAGRNKKKFIEGAIAWPLNNSKLFYSSEIPSHYIDRLKQEMSSFPLWHDDGLNALAYLYDVIKDYHFGPVETEMEKMLKRMNQKTYDPLNFGLRAQNI